jgi:hypothetical protein
VVEWLKGNNRRKRKDERRIWKLLYLLILITLTEEQENFLAPSLAILFPE